MMYANNIAAAIKVNGKILREDKDRVKIPFGSEYSILYKNMNPVRTVFTIQIDGEDAATRIVCDANSSVEVERFFKGNLNAGNRFKFIERTSQIEEHRGIGVEDGLIGIESWKEVVSAPQYTYYSGTIKPVQFGHDRRRTDRYTPGASYNSGGPISAKGGMQVNSSYTVRSFSGSSCITGQSVEQSVTTSGSYSLLNDVQTTPTNSLNEAGITVQGGQSDQQFHYVNSFETEAVGSVLVFHLIGRVGKQHVTRPVTVKTKIKCSICGTVNKQAQFCSKCGTSLVSYA